MNEMNIAKLNKKDYVILLMFLFAITVSWRLYFKDYHQRDTVSVHNFPLQIGDWTGQEIPIKDEDYAVLETRNAFVRKYTDSTGREVFLYVVYSQDNRKVAHPPEICYTGGGAAVLSNKPAVLKIGPDRSIVANKLLIEQGKVEQILFYWFKVGNDFTPSYWKQQLLFSVKHLLGQPSSSALIRLSATLDPDDEWGEKASRNIEDFARQINPYILKYLP